MKIETLMVVDVMTKLGFTQSENLDFQETIEFKATDGRYATYEETTDMLFFNKESSYQFIQFKKCRDYWGRTIPRYIVNFSKELVSLGLAKELL